MCTLCDTWKTETGEGWDLDLMENGDILVKASPEPAPSLVAVNDDPASLYGKLFFILMAR